jgi:hypothetical protein
MPLVLSGSTGIVEGNIADSAVTTGKIASLEASKLTGQVLNDNILSLAASKLTQTFSTNGYMDIGNVRIQWITTTSSSSASGGASPGPSFTVSGILTYPVAFKSGTLPTIVGAIITEYHDVSHPGISNTNFSNTQFRYLFSCYRAAGLENRKMNFVAIGEKP